MADHRLRDLSGQEERALEINIYDEIPLLLAQTQRRRQQVHACIVDQNIDALHLFFDRTYTPLDVLHAAQVKGLAQHLNTV
ncbi:hypothetical protein D3C75_1211330 [compost metagenome]